MQNVIQIMTMRATFERALIPSWLGEKQEMRGRGHEYKTYQLILRINFFGGLLLHRG